MAMIVNLKRKDGTYETFKAINLSFKHGGWAEFTINEGDKYRFYTISPCLFESIEYKDEGYDK